MPRSRHEPPEGIPGISVPLPAPGALGTVQAFVNTAPVDGRGEALASPAALGRWLSSRGLLAAGVEISREDLERALEVRQALRALLAAKGRGELDAAAAERLVRAAGDARCRPHIDDGGPAGFDRVCASFGGALGAILGAFAVARATPDWPHFRLCARRGCRRAFYDGSRSRTGRWCCKRCGNRARGELYRRSRKRRPV